MSIISKHRSSTSTSSNLIGKIPSWSGGPWCRGAVWCLCAAGTSQPFSDPKLWSRHGEQIWWMRRRRRETSGSVSRPQSDIRASVPGLRPEDTECYVLEMQNPKLVPAAAFPVEQKIHGILCFSRRSSYSRIRILRFLFSSGARFHDDGRNMMPNKHRKSGSGQTLTLTRRFTWKTVA